MQKFVFSKTVYARTLKEAQEEMACGLVHAAGSNDILAPLDVRQIARKPPFDKPGTVYYTVRAGRKGPRLGAVMLLHLNGSWHRGVVVCAPPDHFDHEYARRESYRRALMASKGKSLLHIGRDGWGYRVMEDFLAAAHQLPGNGMVGDFQYKAEFACRLTPYEQHLVSKRWPDGRPDKK